MYYKNVNKNVTDAKTPDLLLLFPVCNTFVGEVVTLSPTVSIATHAPTSTGKLYFHVFCALAEFERDLIRERTLAGLEAARTRGRKGGRRRVISERKIQAGVELALDKNRTVGEICETLGINAGSYYRYIYPRLKQQQKQTV